MTYLRLIAVAAISVLLAGCADTMPASRSATPEAPLGVLNAEQATPGVETVKIVPRYNIKAISVVAPRTLRVSEANLIKPVADIVWRGDPKGDRYTQVEAIVADAAGQATARMTQGRAVLLDVEVTRFHALTEKTRYLLPFGGEYEIALILTVRDAKTGALVDGPRAIARDVPAATGKYALEEEAKGYTQKKAVTEAVFQLLREELGRAIDVPAAELPADVMASR